MLGVGLVAAASAGGRSISVSAPTFTHVAGTGFTISNYDASFVYELTAGTRSGNTITLAMSTPCVVTAYAPKGLVPSTTVTIERRTITFNRCEFVQTGFILFNGPCPPGSTCYGTCGPGVNNCGQAQGYTQCGLEDFPPSGFTKQNGEWVKIA